MLENSVKRLLQYLHRDRSTVVVPREVQSRDIGVLGLDSRVHGHIRFRGTLTVDGTVSGDVRSPEGSGAMLVVGQSATVQGDIVADSVLIGGSVTGDIKAKQRIEIFGTGTLHGDIETGDIMIQGGAEFQGRCQMLKPVPALHAGGEGMPGHKLHGDADPAQRGRKAKGHRGERHENGSAGEKSAFDAAGESVTAQQDSRTERGNTTEGPSA